MNIFRWIHIITGSLALLTGAIAIVSAKGSKTHRFSGTWYVRSMWVVVASAVYMSIVKENDFLLCIAIFSFYLTYGGKRAIEKRMAAKTDRTLWDWIVWILSAAGCVWMLLKGSSPANPVLLVFGIILLSNLLRDLRAPRKEKASNVMMIAHIGRMTGAYIATVTAFLVNNITTDYPVVVWLAPTAIGGIFILYSMRRWKA